MWEYWWSIPGPATKLPFFVRARSGIWRNTREKTSVPAAARHDFAAPLWHAEGVVRSIVMIDQREVNVPSEQAKPPANAKEQPEKPETPHRFDDWAAI